MSFQDQSTETKSTNFKVILKNEYITVEKYIQAVQIPGVTINAAIKKAGFADLKLPGDKINYRPLQFNILLDRDYKTYKELWYMIVKNVDVKTGKIIQTDKPFFDTTIVILDNTRNPIFKFKYNYSFVTNFGDLRLDYKTIEDMSFNLTMEYSEIELIED